MRLGLFQQREEMRLEPTVGTETEPRQSLKDQHGGEAATAEPLLSERHFWLFWLPEDHLGSSGKFFKTRRQGLHLNTTNAGLCVGDSTKVTLQRTQDGA